ncbi:hypothetical protein HB662_02645 [Roseomonas frigidaquae]|uniref:Uncharacterized protein n=1 Tax=Falsiroseomonas frigidaquae TaxID=487318 RepID=A0ABX1ETN1_9PROT|nr:hypothetical protein [Falsiroseomonas frigidaquae]NKE43658.1 hypothetical protein [Falsiroseomonas frigidaquae]
MSRMTLTALALGLALPLMPAAIPQAEAQGNVCRNRVFVDSVYQNGLGGNRYEYMVQVRNGTSAPVTLQLNFAGFGSTVTLFSPQLTGITLPAHGNQTIRFGNGTNGNINMGNVTVVYDGPATAARASVAATNCR